MWTFLGLSIALLVALFMFQVETALPGAPDVDVYEEPCEGKAATTEAELPPDPASVPALEPSEATPNGSPTKPVEAQAAVAKLETEAAKREAEPLMPVEVVLQPSEPRLLPFRLIVPTPRDSVPVVRGAMGYRVPLVVKQEVPSRIRGNVYVPAHETYVVLRPGHWEMEEPDKGLVETEPEADAIKAAGDVAKPEPEQRGWLQRLFRRESRGADGGS